jgi:hypothetical protein
MLNSKKNPTIFLQFKNPQRMIFYCILQFPQKAPTITTFYSCLLLCEITMESYFYDRKKDEDVFKEEEGTF